jgi:hypothetical protein
MIRILRSLEKPPEGGGGVSRHAMRYIMITLQGYA